MLGVRLEEGSSAVANIVGVPNSRNGKRLGAAGKGGRWGRLGRDGTEAKNSNDGRQHLCRLQVQREDERGGEERLSGMENKTSWEVKRPFLYPQTTLSTPETRSPDRGLFLAVLPDFLMLTSMRPWGDVDQGRRMAGAETSSLRCDRPFMHHRDVCGSPRS